MSADDDPGPLGHFLAELDDLRSADVLDMDLVGRLLVELAADEEYLGPLIAEMPPQAPELRLVDDRAMRRGDVATLTPPGDIHNHGHVVGTGPSPYSLILLGDDMYLFERKEYDPQQGTWRTLAPGDPGRPHR